MDDFLSLTPPQAIESPCVNVCRIDRGRCLGCRRTLDEIARWTTMAATDRARIMADLPGRTVDR